MNIKTVNPIKICIIQSLFNLQLVSKLSPTIMAEVEHTLENKPTRPPIISTLALRWQTLCPQGGAPSGTGKENENQETKAHKVPFCSIQWQYEDVGDATAV